MKKFLSYFILILLISPQLYGQIDDSEVIAKVGSKVITVKEFKNRFEFVPQVNDRKSVELKKSELIWTLIAEKLWALEAEQKGLDTNAIITLTFNNLEKMYVRDGLYNREIGSKIKVEHKDVQKAVNLSRKTLNLKYLFSNDKKEIDSLYSLLNLGNPFDSLLAVRPERFAQGSPYKVVYGQLPSETEYELFNLESGQWSIPLEASNGWYIFNLISVEVNQIKNDRELNNDYSRVKKILQENAADKYYKEYFTNFFKDKNITANGYLFWSLADKLIDVLKFRKSILQTEDKEFINLQSKDFLKIEEELGEDTLKMQFIELESSSINLHQFIRAFAFEGFYSNTVNPDTVRAKLQSRVKRYIEQELLAEEAYKQGIDKLPELKTDIQIWRDNYLAKLMNSEFSNSVSITENEARQIYNSNKNSAPVLVNIVEVFNDSLEVIEQVFNRIKSGENFRNFAGEYTKRKETKKNNGEFGFFPTTEYGEIGRVAEELEIGEIYGPIELDNGYSLFQLIDKRKAERNNLSSFEIEKEAVIRKLRNEKLKMKTIEKTVELANGYGITIDHNLLESIKVKNLTMLVFKNFGFGGQNMALPVLPIYIDWVEQWQKSKKDLP